MYKVIEYFTDLQDDNFAYNVGDTFPREGKEVSAERFTELSTSANLRGVPLIEEVRGAEETATISEMETVATAEKDSAIEDADNAVPVEEEPKKRGRKRKTDE